MPATINAPNFWSSVIDNVINQSNRTPQNDGSYTFDNSNDPVKTYNDEKQRAFYPQAGQAKRMNPQQYNKNTLESMMGEAQSGTIPYNMAPINQGSDQRVDAPLMDQIYGSIMRGLGRDKFFPQEQR